MPIYYKQHKHHELASKHPFKKTKFDEDQVVGFEARTHA